MPVMDEFKEERELIKERSFQERCSYFWDYYKWHVIGGIAIVALLGGLLHTFLTKKDTAFYAVMLNMSPSLTAESYKEGFAEFAGIDLEKYKVYFDSDMHMDLEAMDSATVSATQKMMVYVAAGDMDVMVADTAGMNQYAYTNVLMDLREFLSEEDYKKYEPYFFYMDRSLLENASDVMKPMNYPRNPSDPDSMADPVPVGIRINDCAALNNTYFFSDRQYFSVIANSKRLELCHTFLDYIWDVPDTP